jgi:outer membrane receptor protein involved in Fe transport
MEGFDANLSLSADSDTSQRELVRSRRFSAVWGRKIDQWHVGISLQYYDDFGQPHPEPNGTGGFAFAPETLRDGTKAAGNMAFSVETEDKKISIQAMYKFTNQDAFLSGQVPSQNLDLYNYKGIEWHASIKYNLSKAFSMTAGGMVAKFRNFVDFLGEPFGGEEYNYDIFLEGNYHLDFKGSGDHSLLAGFKIEREGQYDGRIFLWNGSGFDIDSQESSIFAPNESRNVFALMLEDQWKITDKVRLVGGVRLDYFDGFRDQQETVINPRLAFVYQPSKSFILKGLFATATRPPSIYERLGSALAPLKGSTDVESEKVQTIELSAIFKSGGFKLQVTPFYQTFNDKIEYVAGTGADTGWFVATNNGKTEVLGVDVEAFYYFTKRSYVTFTFSKFESKDKENDHNTYFIPDIYLGGIINWNLKKLNLNINGYYRGKRLLPGSLVVNNEFASGHHFLANMNVSYQLNKWLTCFLLVENITNAENYVPLSVDELFVPLRRRTVHGGFTIRFN